jgi:hypothetical protein
LTRRLCARIHSSPVLVTWQSISSWLLLSVLSAQNAPREFLAAVSSGIRPWSRPTRRMGALSYVWTIYERRAYSSSAPTSARPRRAILGIWNPTFFPSQIDATRSAVGVGKGANLAEMTKAGLPVPPGFCVTTAAYREFAATSAELDVLLDELTGVSADDLSRIGVLGGRVLEHLASLAMPTGIRSAVLAAWLGTGIEHPYAVRSSATAEDLPSGSFAGQQDTYLNIQGEERLLGAVRKCWASLFTDRAIAYRARR